MYNIFMEKEDSVFGEMTIDEAIEHCKDVACDCRAGEGCAAQHNQLASWLTELKELRTKYQYAMADIQNIRKRFERERMDVINQANKELLEGIIDIYDDILSALSCCPDGDIKDGVLLIKKNLEKILDSEGCIKIECKVGDKFDCRYHEALYACEKEGLEPHTIYEITRTGWTLNGKLLRPTGVFVSR
jgi:molecular chaperone GrpE